MTHMLMRCLIVLLWCTESFAQENLSPFFFESGFKFDEGASIHYNVSDNILYASMRQHVSAPKPDFPFAVSNSRCLYRLSDGVFTVMACDTGLTNDFGDVNGDAQFSMGSSTFVSGYWPAHYVQIRKLSLIDTSLKYLYVDIGGQDPSTLPYGLFPGGFDVSGSSVLSVFNRQIEPPLGDTIQPFVVITDHDLQVRDSFRLQFKNTSHFVSAGALSASDSTIALVGHLGTPYSTPCRDSIFFQILSTIGASTYTFSEHVGFTCGGPISSPLVVSGDNNDFFFTSPLVRGEVPGYAGPVLLERIRKYSAGQTSVVWHNTSPADSIYTVMYSGIVYDSSRNRILAFGSASVRSTPNSVKRQPFGYISSINASSGVTHWFRTLDSRPKGLSDIANDDSNISGLQTITDLDVHPDGRLYVVGSVHTHPDSASLDTTGLIFNESGWVAELSQDGCYRGDCGKSPYNNIVVHNSNLGISNVQVPQEYEVTIYPNPISSDGNFNISLSRNLLGFPIIVTSLDGKFLWKGTATDMDINISADLSSYSAAVVTIGVKSSIILISN